MKTRGYEQNIMSETEAVTNDATISAEAATGATLTALNSAVEDTVLHELLQEDDNADLEDTVLHELLQEDDNADDNASMKRSVEDSVVGKVVEEVDDADGNAAIKSEVEETVHAAVAAEDEIVTGAVYEQLSAETGRKLITLAQTLNQL
jgi:hypothetical protein